MRENPLVVTHCGECAFATYEGITQVGCELGRLERAREAGFNVVEARDDDHEFFLIENHACLAKLPVEDGEGRDFDEQVELARKNLLRHLRVHVIVLPGGSAEDIFSTIESLESLTTPPWKTTVITQGSPSPIQLTLKLRGRNLPNWHVKQVLAEVDELGAADEVLRGCRSNFYLMVKPGNTLPPSLLDELGDALFDGERFITLTSPEMVISQTYVHHTFGGHSEVVTSEAYGPETGLKGLGAKLLFVAKDQGKEGLIRDAREVLPCLR